MPPTASASGLENKLRMLRHYEKLAATNYLRSRKTWLRMAAEARRRIGQAYPDVLPVDSKEGK